MTTEEFLEKAQAAGGGYVSAARSDGGFRVTVALHVTNGRLYQTRLIDGTCSRTSPKKFLEEYSATTWSEE